MINYPNGKKINKANNQKDTNKALKAKSISNANRGMDLEHDINISNEFYVNAKKAFIYKRPTPINIVKVDYSKGARITDAYFEKQSTTDYNGVYRGRYIDFEAKATQSKTSFPLSNITKHQIEHLKNVLSAGGIAFFIVEFTIYNEIFLIDAQYIIDYYEHGERKSITHDDFLKHGHLIKQSFKPRIDYLPVVDEIYF